MSRIVKRILAVSLTLVVVLGGMALAATTYNTRLTFRASSTSINRGQDVVFSGKLKSSFAKCYKSRKVTLYRNGKAVDTKHTSSTGHFTFVRHPNRTHTWRAKFAGKTGGTHPNQWACRASASDKVRVEVS